MAIARRSHTTASRTTSGSLTLTEPAGTVEGDILICLVASKHTASVFTAIHSISGWNGIGNYRSGSGSTWVYGNAFWIRRGASAPSLAVIRTAGTHCAAIVIAYSGCKDTDSPVDSTATEIAGSGSGIAISSFNTTVDNDVVLLWGAQLRSSLSSVSTLNMTPAVTNVAFLVTGFSGVAIMAADGLTTTAGAVGGGSFLMEPTVSAYKFGTGLSLIEWTAPPVSDLTVGPSGGVAYGGLFY